MEFSIRSLYPEGQIKKSHPASLLTIILPFMSRTISSTRNKFQRHIVLKIKSKISSYMKWYFKWIYFSKDNVIIKAKETLARCLSCRHEDLCSTKSHKSQNVAQEVACRRPASEPGLTAEPQVNEKTPE